MATKPVSKHARKKKVASFARRKPEATIRHASSALKRISENDNPHQDIVLSRKEFGAFMKVSLNPPKMNKNLREALALHGCLVAID